MRVQLIQWAESQACIGCKHGALVDCIKVGSSAYICLENYIPDGKGEYMCSKHIEEVQDETADQS